MVYPISHSSCLGPLGSRSSLPFEASLLFTLVAQILYSHTEEFYPLSLFTHIVALNQKHPHPAVHAVSAGKQDVCT